MTSLYQIAQEYQEAVNFLENCEDLDQQTISDTLESMQGEFKDKVINVAAYIRNVGGNIICVEDAISVLKKRLDSLKNKHTKLSEYLVINMDKCKISHVESPLFDVKLKENPGRLVIEDESKIPGYFKRITMVEQRLIDCAAIKEAIKDGQIVHGAVLIKDKKITIK